MTPGPNNLQQSKIPAKSALDIRKPEVRSSPGRNRNACRNACQNACRKAANSFKPVGSAWHSQGSPVCFCLPWIWGNPLLLPFFFSPAKGGLQTAMETWLRRRGISTDLEKEWVGVAWFLVKSLALCTKGATMLVASNIPLLFSKGASRVGWEGGRQTHTAHTTYHTQ